MQPHHLIEVCNDGDKPIFVRICRSGLSGRLYVHIGDKPGPHTDTVVEPSDYEQFDDNIHEVDG